MCLSLCVCVSSHGVPVFLDLGGEATPVSPSLLQQVTFLTANETELSRVASLPTVTSDEVLAAASSIRARYGVKNILITIGERGSLLIIDDGSVIQQPACKVDKVVDTTGAGDCFRGHNTHTTHSHSDRGSCPTPLSLSPSSPSLCRV